MPAASDTVLDGEAARGKLIRLICLGLLLLLFAIVSLHADTPSGVIRNLASGEEE